MRTYQVQMQVIEYKTVTVQTEERVTGKELEAITRQQMNLAEGQTANIWNSKDLTPVPRTVKERIKAAFQALRKGGAIARMNYKCCSSCAWAAMETDYPNMKDGDTAVYYHNQDADSLDDFGNLVQYRDWDAEGRVYKTQNLYLAWTGDAHMIIGALENEGLTIDWDGSEAHRIAVTGVKEGSL